MEHLNALVALSRDPEALEGLGFVQDIVSGGLSMEELGEERPAVACQNAMARTFGGVLKAICNRELLSCLWHTHGCPGMFAGLAGDAERDRVLRQMREIHTLLQEELPKMLGTRFRDMQRRSYLTDQFCVQVSAGRGRHVFVDGGLPSWCTAAWSYTKGRG